MTRAETSKLMKLIAYEHEKFLNSPDSEKRFELWAEVFEYVPYKLAEFAVKRTLAESPFAPNLADIVSRVKELIRRDDDNPVDAWNLLSKMAARSTRVTQDEFDALPYEVRRFCGNLTGLRELGNIKEEKWSTVTRGQFMKVYDVLRQRRETLELASPEILEIAQGARPELPSPNVPKKPEAQASEAAACPPPPEFEHMLSKAILGKSVQEGYKPLTEDEFNARRNERIAMLENMGRRT